jgi:phenylalanyl-tRNA synthetase alpha chain
MLSIAFRSSSLIHQTSKIIVSCSYANSKFYSSATKQTGQVVGGGKIQLFDREFETDEWTNLPNNIKEKLNRRLLHVKNNPLNHLKNRIQHFFYKSFVNRNGTPLFSIYDNFQPIVTVEQNFDSLLTPKDHVSRSKKDNFYINKNYLLRAHTTAHDSELIRSGLDCFLTFGDVYRRDEIDAKHYPIFHQCDGVRLFDKNTVKFSLSVNVFNSARLIWYTRSI